MVERNLHNEDNQFLADKIHVLRRILQERPDDLDFLRAEAEWEVAARQFVPYYVRVLDDQMRTVIETPRWVDGSPLPLFPCRGGDRDAGGSGGVEGGRPALFINVGVVKARTGVEGGD